MNNLSLFRGIAVVIDDEINDDKSEISQIRSEIAVAGGYVVGLNRLPDENTDLSNFSGAAFFIVDWNLLGSELGRHDDTSIRVPASLEFQQSNQIVSFLQRLREHRYAPVFVFTNQDVNEVMSEIKRNSDLLQHDLPSHILVRSKRNVIEKGVLPTLMEWINEVPSALVLRLWELEYEKAKNSLFADFYIKSPYWPALLWQTFEEDGLNGSDELGRLISRNLLSRMVPFEMNMDRFTTNLEERRDRDSDLYRNDLLKVLEGERFVRNKSLHANGTGTGDVFKLSDKYYLNIRPDCDCVCRSENEDPELYLLKGTPLKPKEVEEKLKRDKGLFIERDDEAIVFAIYDGKSIAFKLKALYLKKWSEVKDKRIGRLLAPFSTRVQQRYSAYLQRPGIPKIPKAAMPAQVSPS